MEARAPGPGSRSDGNFAAIKAAHTANADNPAFKRIPRLQLLIQICEILLRVAAAQAKRLAKKLMALPRHPLVV